MNLSSEKFSADYEESLIRIAKVKAEENYEVS